MGATPLTSNTARTAAKRVRARIRDEKSWQNKRCTCDELMSGGGSLTLSDVFFFACTSAMPSTKSSCVTCDTASVVLGVAAFFLCFTLCFCEIGGSDELVKPLDETADIIYIMVPASQPKSITSYDGVTGSVLAWRGVAWRGIARASCTSVPSRRSASMPASTHTAFNCAPLKSSVHLHMHKSSSNKLL